MEFFITVGIVIKFIIIITLIIIGIANGIENKTNNVNIAGINNVISYDKIDIDNLSVTLK